MIYLYLYLYIRVYYICTYLDTACLQYEIINLNYLSLCLPSTAGAHTHTHTHTDVYIYIHTHTSLPQEGRTINILRPQTKADKQHTMDGIKTGLSVIYNLDLTRYDVDSQQ